LKNEFNRIKSSNPNENNSKYIIYKKVELEIGPIEMAGMEIPETTH
jgi:hypothetical protein